MSKLVKVLSAVAVMIFGLTTLVGCGYNFYDDWSEAGAVIEKDNVFEAIELDEAKTKIDNDESFVLVLGCSQSSSAVTSISTIQELADYYNYEGTLYFIDATEYISNMSVRNEVKAALGIKETIMSTDSSDIIMVIYDKGEIKLDSSKMKYDENYYEEFQLNGSLNVEALAAYLFVDYKA